MQARFYDPSIGRFISEDPAGFDGSGPNLYIYAGNNPILLIDPLGLCSFEDTRGIIRDISVLDLVPLGWIPIVGQGLGLGLDIAAFAGTEGVLVSDAMAGDISTGQFISGTLLNTANAAIVRRKGQSLNS